MIAGLPGTGIGGIFYFLLAAGMPVCEFFKTIQGKTNLKRWGMITIQLFFVAGIFATMWGEVWGLNSIFFWLKHSYSINCPTIGESAASFEETKTLAFTSGMASMISLSFVILTMHGLNIYVNHIRKAKNKLSSQTLTVPYNKLLIDIRKPDQPCTSHLEVKQPALN
jgi:hypothetical protein